MANKMTREARARQFMPFNALKGYYDLVRQKEIIKEPKKVLDEALLDELSRKLLEIKKRDIVTVKYYKNVGYTKVTGMVSKIDIVFQEVVIVDEKINFTDIIEIKKEN